MTDEKRPELMEKKWVEGTINGSPGFVEHMWMGTYWAPTRRYKREENGEVFTALFLSEGK